jgi:hypothetical protein
VGMPGNCGPASKVVSEDKNKEDLRLKKSIKVQHLVLFLLH